VRTFFLAMTLAIFLALIGASSATSSQTHAGAPYRTEAWAKRMLARVHYWHGYRLDHSFDFCNGQETSFTSHYNGAGEEIYRHFHCSTGTPDFNHDFDLTLHTLRYRPYFLLRAGWHY
jgi:hypothetical protein